MGKKKKVGKKLAKLKKHKKLKPLPPGTYTCTFDTIEFDETTGRVKYLGVRLKDGDKREIKF